MAKRKHGSNFDDSQRYRLGRALIYGDCEEIDSIVKAVGKRGRGDSQRVAEHILRQEGGFPLPSFNYGCTVLDEVTQIANSDESRHRRERKLLLAGVGFYPLEADTASSAGKA